MAGSRGTLPIEIEEAADICKAVSDAGRLRIILALADTELCVCQIVALLDLAPSTISRHLQVLRQVAIIESHKSGKWVFYRLSPAILDGTFPIDLKKLIRTVGAGKSGRADRKRLAEIMKIDTETLCRAQYS